ncbi:unnamed protein product [Closterium sp. NIES-53]
MAPIPSLPFPTLPPPSYYSKILRDNSLSGSIPEAISSHEQLWEFHLRLSFCFCHRMQSPPASLRFPFTPLSLHSPSPSLPFPFTPLSLHSPFLSLPHSAPISPPHSHHFFSPPLHFVPTSLPPTFFSHRSRLDSNQLVEELPSFHHKANLSLQPRLSVHHNYLTAPADALPVNTTNPDHPDYHSFCLFHHNCLANDPLLCNCWEAQRRASECRAFCGAQPLTPPCSSHGVCSFEPDPSHHTAACDGDNEPPLYCEPEGHWSLLHLVFQSLLANMSVYHHACLRTCLLANVCACHMAGRALPLLLLHRFPSPLQTHHFLQLLLLSFLTLPTPIPATLSFPNPPSEPPGTAALGSPLSGLLPAAAGAASTGGAAAAGLHSAAVAEAPQESTPHTLLLFKKALAARQAAMGVEITF